MTGLEFSAKIEETYPDRYFFMHTSEGSYAFDSNLCTFGDEKIVYLDSRALLLKSDYATDGEGNVIKQRNIIWENQRKPL